MKSWEFKEPVRDMVIHCIYIAIFSCQLKQCLLAWREEIAVVKKMAAMWMKLGKSKLSSINSLCCNFPQSFGAKQIWERPSKYHEVHKHTMVLCRGGGEGGGISQQHQI